ncbi:hypothetical protein BDBG_16107 [Blastomyces gilchristii SLH14081]|uniref:Uncharacterized protein n=1 Tax=Blastomyces gilchristii (strain SLH14081) TaxID=559298 RepID=A0A179UB58_BLAGS|nr:uncharacterized protein BDBG_16107 [Blastomyces gilchristii SLH14081]OAT03762.1 hypothetical protein BDBG_16107 [Blastomyces gilchristii SLH14081]
MKIKNQRISLTLLPIPSVHPSHPHPPPPLSNLQQPQASRHPGIQTPRYPARHDTIPLKFFTPQLALCESPSFPRIPASSPTGPGIRNVSGLAGLGQILLVAVTLVGITWKNPLPSPPHRIGAVGGDDEAPSRPASLRNRKYRNFDTLAIDDAEEAVSMMRLLLSFELN